jgi:hypothetical protein
MDAELQVQRIIGRIIALPALIVLSGFLIATLVGGVIFYALQGLNLLLAYSIPIALGIIACIGVAWFMRRYVPIPSPDVPGRRAYFAGGAFTGLAGWILLTGAYQAYLATGHWNPIGAIISAVAGGALGAAVYRHKTIDPA